MSIEAESNVDNAFEEIKSAVAGEVRWLLEHELVDEAEELCKEIRDLVGLKNSLAKKLEDATSEQNATKGK